MVNIKTRVEVITDLLSVKIVQDDKKEWMLQVLFNQGYLVPFSFDGDKFYVETVEKEALKKFREEKEAENKKLNRKKTEHEEAQDMAEMQLLPKEIEEIKVLYKKDPTSPTIDLSLYVKEIIEWL